MNRGNKVWLLSSEKTMQTDNWRAAWKKLTALSQFTFKMGWTVKTRTLSFSLKFYFTYFYVVYKKFQKTDHEKSSSCPIKEKYCLWTTVVKDLQLLGWKDILGKWPNSVMWSAFYDFLPTITATVTCCRNVFLSVSPSIKNKISYPASWAAEKL